jgi:hypothetical protein
MKKGLLLFLLMSSAFFVEAQSLKEALFSGKLKSQTGKVVKKGDDLKALADSARQADSIQKLMAITNIDSINTNDSGQVNTAITSADSSAVAQNMPTVPGNSAAVTATDKSNINATADSGNNAAVVPDSSANSEATNTEAASVTKESTPAPKSNNALLKEYVDTIASTLTRDALSSKKIKKGIYYVTLSYTIGTDGVVDFTEVFLSPENETLQKQIKSTFNAETFKLSPVLSSSGAPRKVSRKYNFTLTKE